MTLVDLDPTPCDDIEPDLELDLELMLCRRDGAEAIISWGMLAGRGLLENVESELIEGVGDPMSEEDDECESCPCPFPLGRSFCRLAVTFRMIRAPTLCEEEADEPGVYRLLLNLSSSRSLSFSLSLSCPLSLPFDFSLFNTPTPTSLIKDPTLPFRSMTFN
jgi:hypothetical protein